MSASEATADVTPSDPAPESLRDELARVVGTRWNLVRDRARPKHQSWLYNHAAWKGIRVQGRAFYESDFKHYIPIARQALERVVTRTTQMLVPSPEFFEVHPGSEYDMQAGRQADSVRAAMAYVLKTRIKIRRVVTQLVRSALMYNRAIVKTTVSVTDAPVRYGRFEGQVQEVWPSVRVVDPFNFFVWPETVTDLHDAMLVGEDAMLPYADYDHYAQMGLCDRLSVDDLSVPVWPFHMTSRLAHDGFSDPSMPSAPQGAQVDDPQRADRQAPAVPPPSQAFVHLSEVYAKVRGRWIMVWLVWNTSAGGTTPRCARARLMPYPEIPYRMALMRPIPGEHYTSSLMDELEPLQVLFNDQLNQAEEARAIAGTPPVKVNSDQVRKTDSIKFKPRAKWELESMDAAEMMAVTDTSQSSVRAMMTTLNLMANMGPNGLASAAPTRGLPRAGGAVNTLVSLAMADVKDIAEIIEEDILTPMLRDIHRVMVTFVPEQQILHIPGTQDYPPRQLAIADLEGNWNLNWVGSQVKADLAGKAQMMVGAFEGLLKLQPQLAQLGMKVDVVSGAKRIWRDAFGERGVEQLIVPMTEQDVAVMQQAMAAQQNPAGPGQPPPPGVPPQ